MIVWLRHFLGWVVGAFRSREDIILENLALRQQLLALHARRPRRRLTASHKLFWVVLRKCWARWKEPLIQVTPRTVVGWHRAGFRLTHSTGHPRRLNRSTLATFERFADEKYSAEELVAEMGAAFLCGFTGIENKTIRNSAAYLRSWLDVLKQDSRLVLIAASQAQKATDMILNQQAPLVQEVTS